MSSDGRDANYRTRHNYTIKNAQFELSLASLKSEDALSKPVDHGVWQIDLRANSLESDLLLSGYGC